MLPELALAIYAGAYSGARSIGRSIEDAEDVAQSCILRLLEKGTEIKPETAKALGARMARQRRDFGFHREPMTLLGNGVWKL